MKHRLQVWWHCISRLFQPGHRSCYVRWPGKPTKYFCECGYMNGGVTFGQQLERMR